MSMISIANTIAEDHRTSIAERKDTQMTQRLTDLEARVDNLERQAREQSFLIRDSTHKIAIAQGLSTVIHDDVQQLKVDMHEVKIELREFRAYTERRLDTMQENIDFLKT